MSGLVTVDGIRIEKAGTLVSEEAQIEVKRPDTEYVGRGGDKLAGALESFSIDTAEKVCIDVGASTGGFTECLLDAGAKLVYAVDVGYGQLAYKLRNDPRVVVMERTNIRHLTGDRLDTVPTLATIDVSFISLELVLPKVVELLDRECDVLALVKPQFEVGKGKVGKGGIVRDTSLHKEVLIKMTQLMGELDLGGIELCPSPLVGAKGNQEYFAHACRTSFSTGVDLLAAIDEAISQAAR